MIRGETDDEDVRELKGAEEIAKKFVAWDIPTSGSIRLELARILT